MIKEIIYNSVKFNNFSEKEFKLIIKNHGLFVFPAGPALINLENNNFYLKSLQEADYVFFDSGYFVLLLKYFKGIKVQKFSGYKFLNSLLDYLKDNNQKKIFLIEPTDKDKSINYYFLKKKYKLVTKSYVAPQYKDKNIRDIMLIKILNNFKPDYVIINLGGGVQEVLGLYIKKNLNNNCSIVCTGGAISFLNGTEAPVNNYFDQFYLGWLIRILFNPRRFLFRYLSSFKLIKFVIRGKFKIIYK
jgi:N-acetylglucosaminyldiphosphoundecaprenol N-acetyl-beta-D-mannosaminyltransferase